MKVGIIGLIPRQQPDIRAIDYTVEIVFYDYAEYNKNNMESFCRKMDKVLFLAGHAPRTALHYAEASKTHIISGNVGVSSVIRYLDEHYGRRSPKAAPAVIRKEPVKGPDCPGFTQLVPYGKPATPPPVVTEDVGEVQYEPLPKTWLGSMIGPYSTEYRIPPRNPIMVGLSGKGNRFDHSILEAAQVGDTLRYKRDPTASLKDTNIRFTYVRNEYSARLTQLLEIHVFKDYVDVHVSGVSVASKKAIPKIRYITDRATIHEMMGAVEHEEEAPVVDEPAADRKPGLKPGTLLKQVTLADKPADEPAAVVVNDFTVATKADREELSNQVHGHYEGVASEVEVGAAVAGEAGQSEEAAQSDAADTQTIAFADSLNASASMVVKLTGEDLAFWRELVLIQMKSGEMMTTAIFNATGALKQMYQLENAGLK